MGKRSDVRITKTVVESLKAGQVVWDRELKGFGARCQAKGRFYVVKYRHGGRQRWLTIGEHGSPWTAEAARESALEALAAVRKVDLASERDKEKAAPTMEALGERFLSEHAVAKRKSRTAAEYRRLFEKVILPAIGKARVRDVTRQDIALLHHSLRATPYQANRVLAILHKAFNLAELWGFRSDDSNPCRHIEKFHESKREPQIETAHLLGLGDALAVYSGSPYAVAAVKLLIFTGARLNEILTLRWDYIDKERGQARLPDSKTGAKTLHLPPPALAVLADLPRVDGNPFVIVGEGPRKRPSNKAGEGSVERRPSHLVNIEKPWRVIRSRATVLYWERHANESAAAVVRSVRERLANEHKKSAKPVREPTVTECQAAAEAAGTVLPKGLTDTRLHDLRHAFASVAASAGMSLPIIGKILGHTQAATTARYAHLQPDPVKAAAATVAGRIADAMGVRDKAKPANVVRIGKS